MSSPCIAAFDSADWRFTVDWDGARTLLYADGGAVVRLQSERGEDVSHRYPELIGTGAAFAHHSMVLDGVVAVVDSEGRPDLRAFGDRLIGSHEAVRMPVVYLATDMLHLDGSSTMRWTLDRRHRTLQRLMATDLRVQVCDLVPAEGHAFAAAAAARNLPAILARRGRAGYHAGVASPDRLRIGLEGRANAVVMGLSPAPGRTAQCLVTLGELANGGWTPAGAMRLGRQEPTITWLEQQCERDSCGAPAGFSESVAESGWIEPRIVATVGHRGRHPDGSLRSPRLIAFRDDIDPRWCVRRDAIQPPAPAGHGFRPTVMAGLPLPGVDG